MSVPSTQLPQIPLTSSNTGQTIVNSSGNAMQPVPINLNQTGASLPTTPISSPLKSTLKSTPKPTPAKVPIHTPVKIIKPTPDKAKLKVEASQVYEKIIDEQETAINAQDLVITSQANTIIVLDDELSKAITDIEDLNKLVADREQEIENLTNASPAVDMTKYVEIRSVNQLTQQIEDFAKECENKYIDLMNKIITLAKITSISDDEKDIENALLEFKHWYTECNQSKKEIVTLNQTVVDKDLEITNLRDSIKSATVQSIGPVIPPANTGALQVSTVNKSPKLTVADQIALAKQQILGKPAFVKKYQVNATFEERKKLLTDYLIGEGIDHTSVDMSDSYKVNMLLVKYGFTEDI